MTATVTAAVVLAVSVTGYTVLQWSGGKISRVDAFAGLTDRPAPSANGSLTFLLVGSDARQGLSHAELSRLHLGTHLGDVGRRADTMLMMHISPSRGRVTVVSLPRDSFVTIPAHRSMTDGHEVGETRNKLNAAYAWGGPSLAVATIERTTGVRIDHYVEVDFLGFVKLVDAVGGVDVCAPTRLHDHKAGLRLPAGVSHIDGETALAYVRARHLDARADLGRVERQQRFLGSMAARVTSKDVLLDPRQLVRFLSAALSAVRADPGLSDKQLVSLGTQLRHAQGKDIRFRTVPIANPAYRTKNAGAVALWDDTASTELFSSMRQDRPTAHPKTAKASPTIPPDQIRVQIYNGSTTVGLGTKAAQSLSGKGFAVVGPAANWRRTDVQKTTLRYDSRYTESIKTLAAAFPGARLKAVDGLGRTLQVVVGSSYDGVRSVTVTSAGPGTGTADDTTTAATDPCAPTG